MRRGWDRVPSLFYFGWGEVGFGTEVGSLGGAAGIAGGGVGVGSGNSVGAWSEGSAMGTSRAGWRAVDPVPPPQPASINTKISIAVATNTYSFISDS